MLMPSNSIIQCNVYTFEFIVDNMLISTLNLLFDLEESCIVTHNLQQWNVSHVVYVTTMICTLFTINHFIAHKKCYYVFLNYANAILLCNYLICTLEYIKNSSMWEISFIEKEVWKSIQILSSQRLMYELEHGLWIMIFELKKFKI